MSKQAPSPLNRREWNASVYHQVSNPHVVWGEKVIASLDLRGDETVIDAGCGTGRVTAMLLDHLPHGSVIGVDQSQNMIDQAESAIGPRYPGRVRFVQSDLLELTPTRLGTTANLIFSTATFHWIRDHDLLFQRLFELLEPGGRLVAQCGGGPNLARLVERAETLIKSAEYAPYFAGFDAPTFHVELEPTGPRLERAGFINVRTELVAAPTVLPDAAAFAEFVTNVIYREHLTVLQTDALKTAFVQSLTEAASRDDPPYELDYWRLNLSATRPS